MKEKAGPAVVAIAVILVLGFAFFMFRKTTSNDTLNSNDATKEGPNWEKMKSGQGYNPGGKK